MNVFWGGVKKSFLFHQKIANVDQGGRNLINLLTVYFVLPLRRRLRLYFFSMRIAFLYQKDSGCFWSTGSHFGYYSWDYGIVSTTVMCVTVCGLFLISFHFWGYISECVECVSKLHTNFLVGNHHRTIVNNMMDSVSQILDPFYWSMQQKNLAGW